MQKNILNSDSLGRVPNPLNMVDKPEEVGVAKVATVLPTS